MPVLSDLEIAREVLLPVLEREPIETLKLRGLLGERAGKDAVAEVRVDSFQAPQAAMLKSGSFYTLYAGSEDRARAVLAELNWLWHQPLGFAGVHEALVPIIAEQAEIEWQTACWRYHLPDDVHSTQLWSTRGAEEMDALTAIDVTRILSKWPYGDPNDPRDRAYVTRLIQNGLGTGWREDGELVCWALTNADGSLGFLHTLESWRGRGLAARVTADLTLKVRAADMTPYGYVVEDNPGPLGILERLGYVRSQERYVWLGTRARA